MLRSIALASFASVTLAACGGVPSASKLADTNVAAPTNRALPAGDYLVRLAQPACADSDLNLSQFNRQLYAQTVPGSVGDVIPLPMQVELRVASVVWDGKVRPTVCRNGARATGVTRVKMDKPFTLAALSEDNSLTIDAVWTFSTMRVQATEGTLLGAGTYLATISQQKQCVARPIEFSKGTRDLGQGIEDQGFAVAGVIGDNLPHTAICMQKPPRSTGTAVVRASAPSTRISIVRPVFASPVDDTVPAPFDDTRVDSIEMVTALRLVK